MDTDDNPQPKRPRANPNDRTLKSRVVAEFVDEIPKPKFHDIQKHRQSFESQPGFREAMMKAMNNPGRAMLLVTYDVDKSKSKQRNLAKLRVWNLEQQGYSEQAGWTIKAVDNMVYVMYNGT